MSPIVAFLLGTWAGVVAGIVIMCLIVINRGGIHGPQETR